MLEEYQKYLENKQTERMLERQNNVKEFYRAQINAS